MSNRCRVGNRAAPCLKACFRGKRARGKARVLLYGGTLNLDMASLEISRCLDLELGFSRCSETDSERSLFPLYRQKWRE